MGLLQLPLLQHYWSINMLNHVFTKVNHVFNTSLEKIILTEWYMNGIWMVYTRPDMPRCFKCIGIKNARPTMRPTWLLLLLLQQQLTMTKVKIYTLDKQDLNRRSAWYAKVEHLQCNIRDPLECRGCGRNVEEGDKVVTRQGRRFAHIYHHSCAKWKHVIWNPIQLQSCNLLQFIVPPLW